MEDVMASGSARLGRPVIVLPPACVATVARQVGRSMRARLQGRMMTRFAMVLVVASVVMGMRPPVAMADTLRVCASGCTFADYSSIQAAIEAARTGDRILIAPG